MRSRRSRDPLASPLPHPKTEGDQGDSRSDEPRRDGDELGLDSRDPVRDSDILRRILGSPAVREDEKIRTRTREIDREGTGGAVHRKQPVAPADERIQLVLFLAEDVQVHDVARERRELPGHPAAADHFDLVHVEPRRSRRNRRTVPCVPCKNEAARSACPERNNTPPTRRRTRGAFQRFATLRRLPLPSTAPLP